MKTLCGVTRREIINELQFCVEQEYKDGFRVWHHGTYKEMVAKADAIGNEFSDFDICGTSHQPQKFKQLMQFSHLHYPEILSINELFKKYAKETA